MYERIRRMGLVLRMEREAIIESKTTKIFMSSKSKLFEETFSIKLTVIKMVYTQSKFIKNALYRLEKK
jgi:hypothetical protein